MKNINDYFEEIMTEIKSEVDNFYKEETNNLEYDGEGNFKGESEEEFLTIKILIDVFDEWVYNHIEGNLGEFVRGYLHSKLIKDYDIK